MGDVLAWLVWGGIAVLGVGMMLNAWWKETR